MAKTEKLIGIYRGAGLNAPALSTNLVSHQLSALIRWKGEGIFKAPSCTQSPLNRGVAETDDGCPFFKRVCFTAKGNVKTVATVAGLFERCSPFTVLGRVVSVIVDAFKACPFGACAHICKEVIERSPSFGDFDSPSAITVKTGSFRVFASLMDALKDAVLACFPFSVTTNFLGMQTSTRTAQTAGERISVYRFFTSTRTPTNPMGVASNFRGVTANSCPSSKGRSSQISEIARGWHATILTQDPIKMGVLA